MSTKKRMSEPAGAVDMKVEGEKLVFYLAARGRKEQSRGWGVGGNKGSYEESCRS